MPLILFFLLMSAPAFAECARSYQAGKALFEEGDAEGAIVKFREALAACPEHSAILDAMGRMEFLKGNYRTSLRFFEQAILFGEVGRALTLTSAATVAMALYEFRRAESYLRQAVQLAPQNRDISIRLAQCLVRSGQHKEAMVILEAGGQSKKSAVALATLAEIYKKEKRLEAALQTLQQALAASVPGRAHAMLLSNIGSLQWDLGYQELSIRTQQAAVEEAEVVFGKDHPDTALILEEFGWLLRKVGRKSESAQAAERAANIRSKYAVQTNERGFSVNWLELAGKQKVR